VGEIEHARRVARRIRAGNLHLNGASGGYDVPFGGFKQSGNGREWGAHGFTDYLEIKALEGFCGLMADYILAIDQGTTGSTVALVDARGSSAPASTWSSPQHFPRPGWVEHEPEAIWASVEKALARLLRKKLCKPGDIAAIGITNQRETTVLWDRAAVRPVHNAIVWQCRRTADFTVPRSRQAGHEEPGAPRSGLLAGSLFQRQQISLAAARRCRLPGAAQGRRHLLGGTIDSYLLWRSRPGRCTHRMSPTPRAPR
jgi:glycerol kinase